MNLNYSYRAFLITSLLFGILFLSLYSLKLTKDVAELEETEEEAFVEYALEDIVLEDEDVAAATPKRVTIKTHRAYNEAEKFISEIESERDETTEETEGNMEEYFEAIDNAIASSSGSPTIAASKKPSEDKKEFSNGTGTTKKTSITKGANTQTTISYRLVERKALDLPNPVYTCMGGGKVVISIEVSETGKVTEATFNKRSSNTSNGCLIDSALDYARASVFTTNADKNKQLGTITYVFPGQQ